MNSFASEYHLRDRWDVPAIRDLILSKTADGNRPCFLFLGKREADLLRDHIGANFGPESVRSLKNHYYLGLEVIELGVPSFFRTSGMKRVRGFCDLHGRAPRRKDIDDNSFWQFSLG